MTSLFLPFVFGLVIGIFIGFFLGAYIWWRYNKPEIEHKIMETENE